MWEALNDFSDFVLSPDDDNADVTDESYEEEDDDDNTPKSDDDKDQSVNAKNDDFKNSGDDNVDDNDVDNDVEYNGGDNGASDNEEGEDNDDNENRVFYMGGMGVGDFNDMLFSHDDDNSLEMTPEMEAAHRCELEENFTEPLLVDDDGNDGDDDRDFLLEDDNEGSGHSSDSCGSGGDNEANHTTSTTSAIAEEENSENENENRSRDNSVNADNVEVEDIMVEDEGEESIDEDAIELKEIQNFLANFDIEAHTEEISQLLSSNDNANADESTTPTPTTPILTPLQHHFQNLVPQTVSYPNFWKRYYYRCDPHRIALQWERQAHHEQLLALKQQKERERALKEVSNVALSIGRSAASFLKGGWNVTSEAASDVIGGVGEVVHVTTEAAAEAFVGVGDVVEEAASSLRVHQVKGRPLFVMGGMEEDDDSYYEDDDVEVEEEIDLEDEEGEGGSSGWNVHGGEDDEEEEIVILAEEEEEEGDEEVNFLEVSLLTDNDGLDAVRLRKSLMHAEEERNTLMQMVDERTAEMSKLRSVLLEQEQQRQHCPPVSGPGTIHGLEREVEWLNHLVAATVVPTDSSDARDASVNALKSILIQMREELLLRQKTKPTDDKSAISKSTQDSKAIVVRDLESKIQALKDNNTPDNTLPNNETLPESSERDALLRGQLHHQTNEKCNKLRLETEETNQCIAQRQAQLQILREKLRDKE